MKNNDETILVCKNIAEWEDWLQNNYSFSKAVWLKIGKKGSLAETISISDALDVALCYGWIDSK
jgi:uncharacterized protein YdeI (YjbR/CyaY-like superfamily)